jgi:catechol 2,3-dioxygenase-like lactoylglutathione lyase family enzyme
MMSTSNEGGDALAERIEPGKLDMKLEVVTVAVTDVDRAKRFYQRLGWRLDADIVVGDHFRVVQLTPPHSACSVAFGKGLTSADPGSAQRLILAVQDVDAVREDLVRRGIEVSGVFHLAGGPVPGPDPERRSYQSYVSFSDPDGNAWLLQEIRTRLPGREWEDRDAEGGSMSSTNATGALAELLHETSLRHGSFEAVAPQHDWWDWYAAYVTARQEGRAPDDAATAANRYMADVRHVVVPAS